MDTGYENIDNKFNLLAKGELTVLAGPARVGKTSLAVSVAHHRMIEDEDHVVIFSLDENTGTLGKRFIHLDTEIPLYQHSENIDTDSIDIDEKNPEANSDIIGESAKKFKRLINQNKLSIREDDELTLAELQSLSYDHYEDIDLIIIDSIKSVEFSRDTEIENDSDESLMMILLKELKKLARDLEIPVLVISEMSEEEIVAELSEVSDTVAILERQDFCREERKWNRELKVKLNCIPEPAKLKVVHNISGQTGEHELIWKAPLLTFKERSEKTDKIISDVFSDLKKE